MNVVYYRLRKEILGNTIVIGDSTIHITMVHNINIDMQNDIGVFGGDNSFLLRIDKPRI